MPLCLGELSRGARSLAGKDIPGDLLVVADGATGTLGMPLMGSHAPLRDVGVTYLRASVPAAQHPSLRQGDLTIMGRGITLSVYRFRKGNAAGSQPRRGRKAGQDAASLADGGAEWLDVGLSFETVPGLTDTSDHAAAKVGTVTKPCGSLRGVTSAPHGTCVAATCRRFDAVLWVEDTVRGHH